MSYICSKFIWYRTYEKWRGEENNCKVILDKRAVGDDNILYVVGKIDEITDDIAPSDDNDDYVDA